MQPDFFTPQLITAVVAFTPADAVEESHRTAILNFIAEHPSTWWRRDNVAGHVTASAWILNAACTHALLLHHRKLNRWLQPGGHIEASDTSAYAAACREAREETGVASDITHDDTLFDVDVHPIPARAHENAHLHYDLRYCIIVAESHVTLSDESLGARWLAIEQLIGPTIEPSISRMARKSSSRKLL